MHDVVPAPSVKRQGQPVNGVNSVAGQKSDNFLLHVTDKRTNAKWLVDGGALLSIVPPTPQQRLKGPDSTKLKAANGSDIACYGTLEQTIQIGQQSFTFVFTIADVQQRIIGADFLAHFYLAPNHRDAELLNLQDFSTLPAQHARGCISMSINYVRDEKDDPYYKLLETYPEILTPTFRLKDPEHGVKHRIPTDPNLPPIQSRARRLDTEKLAVAKKELEKLEALGICHKGNSEWSSPLLVTTKPCGGWRVCGDYRRLNGRTTDDRYPVRTLQDFTAELHGKSIFSKIDLLKGYHQIPVQDVDICKTAVITPFGLYVFPRCPFGLKNAGQDFQRLMDEILGDLPRVFVYIDDILIASESKEQHLEDLEAVFKALAANGLVIQRSKCLLGVSSLDFLGYAVDSNGIAPLPDRVVAIKATTPPTTVKELQRFLGMVGYYRRFIPKAADHLFYLFEALKGPRDKKPKLLDWTPECQTSFEATKSALAEATLLHHPRPGAQLALTTDASNMAIGGVLEQRGPKGWEPLAFYSSKLEPNQRLWPPYDRELLAAFKGTRHFRTWVEGRPFTLYTDHQSLVPSIHKKTDPQTLRQTYQLACIAEYTTDIVYVEGKANLVADALSRPNEEIADISSVNTSAEGATNLTKTGSSTTPSEDPVLRATAEISSSGTATSSPTTSSSCPPTGSATSSPSSASGPPTTSSAQQPVTSPPTANVWQERRAAAAAKFEAASADLNCVIASIGDMGIDWVEIARQQPLDPDFRRLRDDANSGLILKSVDIGQSNLFVDMSNGVARPFIPFASRRRIFEVLHGLGHPGVARTRQTVADKVVWPSMREDVSKWSRECLACQQAKVTKHVTPPIGDFEVPSKRFQHCNVDIVTLPLSNGFRYLFTAVDRFTRWPIAVPMKDISTESVLDAFNTGWVQAFGVPSTITSDNGSQFSSALFNQLTRTWGIQLIRTAPYHPEANGLVERFHRRLKEALIALGVDTPQEWYWRLPCAMLGIRTTVKPDIGASPADLVYGEGLSVPGEMLPANPAVDERLVEQRASALADLRLEVARMMPTQTSAHRTPQVHLPADLQTCTHVFIRRGGVQASLASPYTGPYRVVSRNDQNFRVAVPGRANETVAIARIKPANASADDAQDAEPPSPPRPGRRPRPPNRRRRRAHIVESDEEVEQQQQQQQQQPLPPVVQQPSPPGSPLRTPPAFDAQFDEPFEDRFNFDGPHNDIPEWTDQEWFDPEAEDDAAQPDPPPFPQPSPPTSPQNPPPDLPQHRPSAPRRRLFSRPGPSNFCFKRLDDAVEPPAARGASGSAPNAAARVPEPEAAQRPKNVPKSTKFFSKAGPTSFSRRRKPDVSAIKSLITGHLYFPASPPTSPSSHECGSGCETD